MKPEIQNIRKYFRENRLIITIITIIIILNILSLYYIFAMTGRARLERAQNPFSPTLFDRELGRPSDRKRYEIALIKVVQNSQSEEDRALKILSWVMNQVQLTGNEFSSRSSWELVEHAQNGGGLLCGQMAQILHDALISSHIPARRIMLQTDIIGLGETHVVVEAFVDGRWIVLDPTFHVTLRAHNRRISALEAQQLTQTIGHNSVQIEFLGEVKYPARTTSYHYNYLSLYKNAFIETRMGHASYIPLINYWIAPVWEYKQVPHISNNHILSYKILYYFAMYVLPILILKSFLILLMQKRKLT